MQLVVLNVLNWLVDTFAQCIFDKCSCTAFVVEFAIFFLEGVLAVVHLFAGGCIEINRLIVVITYQWFQVNIVIIQFHVQLRRSYLLLSRIFHQFTHGFAFDLNFGFVKDQIWWLMLLHCILLNYISRQCRSDNSLLMRLWVFLLVTSSKAQLLRLRILRLHFYCWRKTI